MAKFDEQSIDAVTTCTRLVAERQAMAFLGQPLRQLGNVSRGIWDRTNEPDRAVSSLLCRCNRDARLMNIKPNVNYLLHAHSPTVETPRPH